MIGILSSDGETCRLKKFNAAVVHTRSSTRAVICNDDIDYIKKQKKVDLYYTKLIR